MSQYFNAIGPWKRDRPSVADLSDGIRIPLQSHPLGVAILGSRMKIDVDRVEVSDSWRLP